MLHRFILHHSVKTLSVAKKNTVFHSRKTGLFRTTSWASLLVKGADLKSFFFDGQLKA
jgi:hypothetical protein